MYLLIKKKKKIEFKLNHIHGIRTYGYNCNNNREFWEGCEA